MSAGDHTPVVLQSSLENPNRMTINVEVVDTLPENAKKSARHSVCRDIVVAAQAAAPQYLKVSAATPEELIKVYKSMIQFKTRYKETLPFEMRKSGESLFVWVPTPEEAAA